MHARALTLALCVALFATRVPFIVDAQRGALWTIDELELTLTTADRFLGVPHTGEHWSGASFQLALLPVLAIDAASHGATTLQRFTLWLGEGYRSPWHWLLLARLLVAALTSIGLAGLVTMLRGYAGTIGAIVAVVVIATLPQIWIFSTQAVANGMALAASAFAIALADRDEGGRTAGPLAAGLAVASRTVFVPIVPFVCAICARRSRRPYDVFRAAVLVGVAFVAACPYIWIEPMRFAKATIGNVMKPGGAIGVVAATGIAVSAASVAISVLAVVAFVVAIVRGERMLAGGLIAALALVIIPAARASVVEARYFLSLALILPVFVAMVLGPAVAVWAAQRPVRTRRALAVAAVAGVAILVAFNTATVAATARAEKSGFVEARQVVDFIDSAARWDDARMAMPESVAQLSFDHLSAGAARRLTRAADDAAATGRSQAAIEAAYPVPDGVLRGLLDDFNEDERAFEARMRIRAEGADTKGVDLDIYGNAQRAQRLGILTRDQAVEAFLNGGVDVLVLDQPLPRGPQPTREIGHYTVFVKAR